MRWHTYRWETTTVVNSYSSQKLDALLKDGWEPFAVSAPGGVDIYHLRRIKHEVVSKRRRRRGQKAYL